MHKAGSDVITGSNDSIASFHQSRKLHILAVPAETLVIMPIAAAIARSSNNAACTQHEDASPVSKVAKLGLRQRDPEQGDYADSSCHQA